MTQRFSVTDINSTAEQRLAQRLLDNIRPVLAGRPPKVQGAVLIRLVAEWLRNVPAEEREDAYDLLFPDAGEDEASGG
jgi:hypothetical protein